MKDHTRELLAMSRPNRFNYDHSSGLFQVGGTRITPLDLPVGFGDLALDTDKYLTDDELDAVIRSDAVVQTVMQPVALPKLYDWLQDNMSRQLFDETADIMREVMIQIRPDLADISKGSLGFRGFGVNRIREGYPHLLFQTRGDCACMAVSQYGIFDDSMWDEKVTGFSNHNVDTREQEVSLLAGLGHIAYKASQDI